MIYRFVLSYCFVLMKGSQYEYVLITLVLVGSMILFFKFHNAFDFHNEVMGMLWSVLMSLYVWTALLLFFAKVLFIYSLNVWNVFIIKVHGKQSFSREFDFLDNRNSFHHTDSFNEPRSKNTSSINQWIENDWWKWIVEPIEIFDKARRFSQFLIKFCIFFNIKYF